MSYTLSLRDDMLYSISILKMLESVPDASKLDDGVL